MHEKRILVVDTETGGIGPDAHLKYSIFQLGAVVWENGAEGESFEALIREPVLMAQPEALIVNGITPQRLLNEGLDPEHVTEKFIQWLAHAAGYENVVYGSDKIILGGHNVGYDASFISRLFQLGKHEGYFEKLFSHRMIDTASIARFLTLARFLPERSASSKSLFEHFGCKPNKPHDALSDAKATAKLLTEMLGLVRLHSPILLVAESPEKSIAYKEEVTRTPPLVPDTFRTPPIGPSPLNKFRDHCGDLERSILERSKE